MKISVQSLFEDYEENAVSLNRDADAERILEKTRAKLPGLKKRRPVGLVLIAAAAVAVLCGAGTRAGAERKAAQKRIAKRAAQAALFAIAQ